LFKVIPFDIGFERRVFLSAFVSIVFSGPIRYRGRYWRNVQQY